MLNATGLRPVAKNKIQENPGKKSCEETEQLTMVEFYYIYIVKLGSSGRGNPAFGRWIQNTKKAGRPPKTTQNSPK